MSATSNALTGKSSRARSVWGTYAGRPGRVTSPRRCASSPSSARNSVVLPPPLGPSTATISPGAAAKPDLADRVPAGRVAAREPAHGDPGHAATARDARGERHDGEHRAAEHGGDGPGADVEAVGHEHGGHALGRGERGRGRAQGADAVGEQPRGGRRDDQHHRHEQRADGIERHDRRGRDAGEQEPLGPHRAEPERAGAAGLEAGGQPVAAQRGVQHDGARGDGGGEPDVALAQADQRAEQEPVDARSRCEHVGGEHDPGGQCADQQQSRGGVGREPAGVRDPLLQHAEAERARERRQLRRDPPRARQHEPGEADGADGVREEREPPQHDPGPEQPGRHGQQQHLDQRALQVGRHGSGLRAAAFGAARHPVDERGGVGGDRAHIGARRRSPRGRACRPTAAGPRARRRRARSPPRPSG